MEEYVNGTVHTYDAVINSKGEPLFETGNVTIDSIMDIVNTNGNSCYYIEKTLPEAMRDVGRRTVAAFGVKSRFVHLEFFVLNEGSARARQKRRHPRSGSQHAPVRRFQRGYVQFRQLDRRV